MNQLDEHGSGKPGSSALLPLHFYIGESKGASMTLAPEELLKSCIASLPKSRDQNFGLSSLAAPG